MHQRSQPNTTIPKTPDNQTQLRPTTIAITPKLPQKKLNPAQISEIIPQNSSKPRKISHQHPPSLNCQASITPARIPHRLYPVITGQLFRRKSLAGNFPGNFDYKQEISASASTPIADSSCETHRHNPSLGELLR